MKIGGFLCGSYGIRSLIEPFIFSFHEGKGPGSIRNEEWRNFKIRWKRDFLTVGMKSPQESWDLKTGGLEIPGFPSFLQSQTPWEGESNDS